MERDVLYFQEASALGETAKIRMHSLAKDAANKLEVALGELEAKKKEVLDVHSKLEVTLGELDVKNKQILDVQSKLEVALGELEVKNESLKNMNECNRMNKEEVLLRCSLVSFGVLILFVFGKGSPWGIDAQETIGDFLFTWSSCCT